jgi:hypothetical protein
MSTKKTKYDKDHPSEPRLLQYVRGVEAIAREFRVSVAQFYRLKGDGLLPLPDGRLGKRGQVWLYKPQTIERWHSEQAARWAEADKRNGPDSRIDREGVDR